MVGTRHADQCAKRWTQCLDPSIDHSDWREEEDNRLLAGVAASGRNWRKIADLFPGRTKLALKNRYTALRRKQHSQQTATNGESPQLHPRFSAQIPRSVSDDMMQISDELASSEEEICSSMGSTRPPSRSSNHSKKSQQQTGNFNMVVDASSGLTTPASNTDSGDLFHYMAHTPNQNFGFQHRQSVDHPLLDSSNFSPMNLSTLSEPMLTPRPEYMPSAMLDTTYPLHASSLPNEWLSGGTTSNPHMHGFPFPESFDVSPMSGIDRHYLPQQTSSRKTTIVLEDIEETTLSKVMNILIQEKAKVRMETTHSDRAPERR
ncbi:Myb-like DNA-binding domain-containing protein [Cladophialophora immunda]|nr:Myb-like DNA-binding domain-containing protein [Cladophialophora immunda]